MSTKGSCTTSDYLNFDEVSMKALRIIKKGKQSNLGLMVLVGINIGLRISDLLMLTFNDLEQERLILIESKTGKRRIIRINNNIKEALILYKGHSKKTSGLIFTSKNNRIYTVQYVNRWLKQNFGSNKLRVSSHSLRKTFARKAYTSAENQESVLVFLSEIFNHSSLSITKRYLGIRQQELDDIYLTL
jgi:integrase